MLKTTQKEEQVWVAVNEGFSHRQGRVRIFDARIKILMRGCQI